MNIGDFKKVGSFYVVQLPMMKVKIYSKAEVMEISNELKGIYK